MHRDRHAGTVLRRRRRRQPLAAGVQRPRHRPRAGAGGRRTTTARRRCDRRLPRRAGAGGRRRASARPTTTGRSPTPQRVDQGPRSGARRRRGTSGRRACAAGCGTSWRRSADQRRPIAGAPEPLVQPGGLLPAARASATRSTATASSSCGSCSRGAAAGTAEVPRPAEGGADYWIMWRRVAGGLNTALQNTLFTRLRPVLLPGQGQGTSSKPGANELAEMWRAAASLERLDAEDQGSPRDHAPAAGRRSRRCRRTPSGR